MAEDCPPILDYQSANWRPLRAMHVVLPLRVQVPMLLAFGCIIFGVAWGTRRMLEAHRFSAYMLLLHSIIAAAAASLPAAALLGLAGRRLQHCPEAFSSYWRLIIRCLACLTTASAAASLITLGAHFVW
jgi:hypothetical protein